MTLKYQKLRVSTLLLLIIFTSDILNAKIKQKESVNKCDFFNLVKNSDFNTKLVTLAIKVQLKAEQDKIVKLQTHVLNCTLGKKCFGDGGSQNMFVYQPALHTLDLKKDKGTDYVLS